ncbi:MAG: helicase C-terminal domain-containing protein [Parachlamydiales bacterium]
MSENPTYKELREDKTLPIISEEGLIQRHLPSFEVREQQRNMLKEIIHSYNQSKITLIEAGTGTGKSMAYLIPALLWSLHNKQITVISTNTIALQEQLVNKDIPLINKALNLEFKAVLVKGMGNYLCRRKLEDTLGEIPLLTPEEANEVNRIEAWSQHTTDGSRSGLPISPPFAIWEKVNAEGDNCTREKCPYFKSCFFFKARAEAMEAQLLIVNHHLLFSDISRRIESQHMPSSQNIGILPSYTRIILDEAHNLEDVATDYLAMRTSLAEIMRLFGLLATDKQLRTSGKLPLLKTKIEQIYQKKITTEAASFIQRIQVDLIGQRRVLMDQFFEVFSSFRQFALNSGLSLDEAGLSDQVEGNYRIHAHHHTHDLWLQDILPKVSKLEEDAKRYFQSINSLMEDIHNAEDARIQDQTRGLRAEIQALRLRLEKALTIIVHFAKTPPTEKKVRWIELQQTRSLSNTHIVDAELDISTLLAQQFFSRFETSILCSATLATNREFHFLRSRLGLTPQLLPYKKITEKIFDSPFDYEKQSLLLVPTDLPLPNEDGFNEKACSAIMEAIHGSRGNAFVLFTSYSMLKGIYEKLYPQLIEGRYKPCKQGDAPRQVLLNNFKNTDRSVLFGTDSFWEGVDVAGEALRCVIIVKLPFQVPSEPIIEARTNAIIKRGGNPFLEFSVPNAIVKFKQGFGRLIRHKKDRGCIVCLDTRLINKAYGKLFLNSLPKTQMATVPLSSLRSTMDTFYRKTYSLTL